jgi:hypothetical protein
MRSMRAFPGWSAVSQIIGRKKIGLGRVVKNIIAGIDAGVKVRVDKARRNQAASGVDLSIDRWRVFFTDPFDSVAVNDYDAVLDDLMFVAVETYDVAALDQRFHRVNLSGCEFGQGQD